MKRERREFKRLPLPATALMLDEQGNEMGQVQQASGGGVRLFPASPWAKLGLIKGDRITVIVNEPASGTRTRMNVEVRHVSHSGIGLKFL